MNVNGVSRAREEAVRWFALLHGPGRTADADLLFRKWCTASEENEAAYDRVTQVWDRTRHLRKDVLPMPEKWRRAGFRSGFFRAITAVAAAVAVMAIASFVYLREAGLRTAIGEQRTVTLEDGTRVSLNTGTQLRVRFNSHQRRLLLDNGEAMFEVAQEARRPFVVQAGGREIKALGTVFVVRSDEEGQLAVTLMEGKVSVSAAQGSQQQGTEQTMQPGERLTFAKLSASAKSSAPAPARDRPEVQKVIAWRQGRIEMDRMPLYVASAEMNRYSAVKLRVERPEAQVIPVTGSFRTGDVASFADTLVRTCHLQSTRKDYEVVLSGMPSENCR